MLAHLVIGYIDYKYIKGYLISKGTFLDIILFLYVFGFIAHCLLSRSTSLLRSRRITRIDANHFGYRR